VRLPGRVYYTLRLYARADDGPEGPYRPGGHAAYLEVPHRYPIAELAGLAYEATAAVLVGRLLGRDGASEGGIVRA
jgi:hypothetical protein